MERLAEGVSCCRACAERRAEHVVWNVVRRQRECRPPCLVQSVVPSASCRMSCVVCTCGASDGVVQRECVVRRCAERRSVVRRSCGASCGALLPSVMWSVVPSGASCALDVFMTPGEDRSPRGSVTNQEGPRRCSDDGEGEGESRRTSSPVGIELCLMKWDEG